jgi:uncharacterized membrane protein
MMTNLRAKLRQATIIVFSILCVLTSARIFFVAASREDGSVINLVFGAVLLALAFAIFRQYRWALRLAAAICLLVAVILPLGLFNPFTAGDYMAAGKEPHSVMMILLWLIPLEVLLLSIAFLIDPRRKDREKP